MRIAACAGNRWLWAGALATVCDVMKRMIHRYLGFALCLIVPLGGWAIGPHELAVVCNAASRASCRLAEAYVELRGIPSANLIRVNIPAEGGSVPFEIAPEVFTRAIWGPVMQTLAERGLRDQVLAWAYSTDLPLRITAHPPLSIQGLTYLRNRLPAGAEVKDGTYRSLLFGGEGLRGHPGFAPQTFDVFREWLGADMPLPSMLLGVSGKRGNREADILASLRRGAASDATHPRGRVFFVESDDVRSACRAWQFPTAVKALSTLGIDAQATRQFPDGARDVIGLMMGGASVDPKRVGAFLPGAMAEHLTSFAGDFANAHQTKLTAWIAAGASASAGTVTEPYSIPAKFPMARFFAFYASGCPLIESFYQAVACPLQLVMVGDPLACPWLPRYRLMLEGAPAVPARDPFTVRPRLTPGADAAPTHFSRYRLFLDDRPVAGDPPWSIDPGRLDAGRHTLRAVAYATGLVRSQIHAVGAFTSAPREASP